ncbi:MAG: sugar phosphate isomerase/epimerase family protein [Candidatus Firestonebacteria bacterium]
MFQPKLGVSLHTIMLPLVPESLEEISKSSIATLEISPKLFATKEQQHLLKQMLSKNKIRVASIHTLFGGIYDFSILDENMHQNAIAQFDISLKLAIELNAPLIVLHASSDTVKTEERQNRLKQAKKGLKKIEEQCIKFNKKIAVEVLPRTCLGNTIEELLKLIEGLDEQTFGICLDTNHLMSDYQDLPNKVRMLNKKLMTLHLSDYDGIDEKHQIPGTGVINWKSFMTALNNIDYKGPFNYECKIEGETISSKIKSLETNFNWICNL